MLIATRGSGQVDSLTRLIRHEVATREGISLLGTTREDRINPLRVQFVRHYYIRFDAIVVITGLRSGPPRRRKINVNIAL